MSDGTKRAAYPAERSDRTATSSRVRRQKGPARGNSYQDMGRVSQSAQYIGGREYISRERRFGDDTGCINFTDRLFWRRTVGRTLQDQLLRTHHESGRHLEQPHRDVSLDGELYSVECRRSGHDRERCDHGSKWLGAHSHGCVISDHVRNDIRFGWSADNAVQGEFHPRTGTSIRV